MKPFDAELRRLAVRLDLPEPARSRMLLELRTDLEGMASSLRAAGAEEVEAHRRAVEALLPSAEAVEELGRVHRPLYQRWVERFSHTGRHRLERACLAGFGLLQLAIGLVFLRRLDLLETPSPFLWPALGLGVAIGGLGAAKLVQLYVLRAHGRTRLRRGLGTLLVLGAAAVVLAAGGVVADLYATAARIQAAPARQGLELLEWLRRDTALVVVTLLAAWAAGAVWLVASVRVARLERIEADALGLSFTEGRRS